MSRNIRIFSYTFNTLDIIFIIIGLGSLLYLAINYLYSSNSFKDVGPYQQYYLDPRSYDPNYFNKSLYSVPGCKANPKVMFGNNTTVLPMESNIPSIDVLRAHANMNPKTCNKYIIPAYSQQYIDMNTSPIAVIMN